MQERETWQEKAATVAAWRESHGHDDLEDALGPAPAPGHVESFAAYRAAWRALGRPEIDREELELSDGQLRIRVRAYEREATWAPRYVGNELAGTHQALAAHRQTEQLRRAEAAAAAEKVERARLAGEAEQARALVETLEWQAAQLAELDDARSRWLAHTAGTRAAAERAKAELAARHADDIDPDPKVTAAQWLANHRAAVAEDERHREITDADVRDEGLDDAAAEDETVSVQEDEADESDGDHHEDPPVAEQPDRDIREIAADEPGPKVEDDVRVPSADETAAAVESSQRALAEIRAREIADAAAEEQHRAEQLSSWHAHDQILDAADSAADDVDEPDLVDADQL